MFTNDVSVTTVTTKIDLRRLERISRDAFGNFTPFFSAAAFDNVHVFACRITVDL